MTQRPSLLQIVKAVIGAMVGVQSEKQRQQDFSASSPVPFIIAGIIFTLFFVLTLLLIVFWVLA
ncbi:MAG: DUF2970 domain-containing protein [Gammaproteobacteria bacterium]|nr:DUF2970 domain-containing protein [Gammaproteobacteria bacterium]MBU1555989.1 DUF2970 domain-containing protein [Gammaproteobacteria bacterium]MBU2070374.1 DUF2970 domain-containing protein [Gammaproteobacteria bacterium]MBU2184764.1 DUF2970 domain-containing protein [Gammaproteobacteria bacterium]MBU2203679.1 DUF2970 domain-containing protein [Gammaproteobacteria bacterium]